MYRPKLWGHESPWNPNLSCISLGILKTRQVQYRFQNVLFLRTRQLLKHTTVCWPKYFSYYYFNMSSKVNKTCMALFAFTYSGECNSVSSTPLFNNAYNLFSFTPWEIRTWRDMSVQTSLLISVWPYTYMCGVNNTYIYKFHSSQVHILLYNTCTRYMYCYIFSSTYLCLCYIYDTALLWAGIYAHVLIILPYIGALVSAVNSY